MCYKCRFCKNRWIYRGSKTTLNPETFDEYSRRVVDIFVHDPNNCKFFYNTICFDCGLHLGFIILEIKQLKLGDDKIIDIQLNVNYEWLQIVNYFSYDKDDNGWNNYTRAIQSPIQTVMFREDVTRTHISPLVQNYAENKLKNSKYVFLHK